MLIKEVVKTLPLNHAVGVVRPAVGREKVVAGAVGVGGEGPASLGRPLEPTLARFRRLLIYILT